MPDTVIVSPPDNRALVTPFQVKQIFPADNRAVVVQLCDVTLDGTQPETMIRQPDNKVIVTPKDFEIWPAVSPGPEYKRSYSYKGGQLTFPPTPQAFGQEWTDNSGSDEILWQCAAGDTVWRKVNMVKPGV